MKRLDGKIAVVTGASSGIGRLLVECVATEGAKVVAFGRNGYSLESLEVANPAKVIAVIGDVTRQEDLDRLLTSTVDRLGAIDILVPTTDTYSYWRSFKIRFDPYASALKSALGQQGRFLQGLTALAALSPPFDSLN